jgi:hypothetical protein
MAVAFGEMKPDAERHEHGSGDEANRQRVAQEQNRDGCPHKRRD